MRPSAQALDLVDNTIKEAIKEGPDTWVSTLCGFGAVIAVANRDRQREIQYKEKALTFASEYAFAAFNLAQLLHTDGQLSRAEYYATEAYKLSVVETTQAARDLVAAIQKQWPRIRQDVHYT